MPSKDFKAGLKANSLNGRKLTREDATVPFGYNPVRDELEQQAEELPVIELPIIQLHDNPYQHLARPRLNEEALEELASSIQQNGFYGALLARRVKNSSDQYELAYGHRRKEAARRAGLITLPVKVIELSNDKMVRIMASENFARQDLDPLGEANVVGLLESTQNLSARQIAEIIGKGRSWVERRIALYHAPQDLKDLVSQKPDALSLMDLLITLKDTSKRQNLIQQILTYNLTRKEVQDQLDQITKPQTILVNDFTISPVRGDGEKSNNDSSSQVDITKEKLDTNNIVKNSTISPVRGDGEKSNDFVGGQHTWEEAIGLIAQGISMLDIMTKQENIPQSVRRKATALSNQLIKLLKEG